jgi:hypothetical protein
MYKLIAEDSKVVQRLSDNAFIPFDPANTDYANFKRHIQGFDSYNQPITPAELQDADGNTMTAEEVAEFVATLP